MHSKYLNEVNGCCSQPNLGINYPQETVRNRVSMRIICLFSLYLYYTPFVTKSMTRVEVVANRFYRPTAGVTVHVNYVLRANEQ